ncbi:hypothetical protein E2562_034285 [Oryza meyeriana var. granulata]|uniref:Uncharacterized protein n=1 Tax=Oryza meyeriana var. granulata TaxID=110450 RepID=A0A6G1DAI4_9ORYZ|nr:hypothetical protein E2562_034285 [Oryza meyeriana var. granulata]
MTTLVAELKGAVVNKYPMTDESPTDAVVAGLPSVAPSTDQLLKKELISCKIWRRGAYEYLFLSELDDEGSAQCFDGDEKASIERQGVGLGCTCDWELQAATWRVGFGRIPSWMLEGGEDVLLESELLQADGNLFPESKQPAKEATSTATSPECPSRRAKRS